MMRKLLKLLFLLPLLPSMAFAASPRDAIQTLPQFSHRSEFRIIESDLQGSHSFSDEYSGRWEMLWNPPSIRLGASSEAIARLRYSFDLGDTLNRQSGISQDARRDDYDFSVELKSAPAWRLFYRLNQTDSFNAQTGARRTWRSIHADSFNLDYTPANLPELHLFGSSTRNYGFDGPQQTDSSFVDRLQARIEQRRSNSMMSERHTLILESNESGSYAPDSPVRNPGGNENVKVSLSGNRQFPLPNAGTLSLDYAMEEDSIQRFAEVDETRNSASLIAVGWNGSVQALPLRYNFIVRNSETQLGEQPNNSTFIRQLNLEFVPRVQEGKSATLSFATTMTENEAETIQTSTDSQNLVWAFNANRNLSGRLEYNTRNTTNRLIDARTEEVEEVVTRLSYNLPGAAGGIDTELRENVSRNPSDQSRTTSNLVGINNRLNLGQRGRIEFFLNQQYSDSQSSPIALVTSNDLLSSGVRYYIANDSGLSVNATLANYLRTYSTGSEDDTQRLNVTFTYRPAPNWNYQLILDATDEAVVLGDHADARRYQTTNRIFATFTYSF